MKRLIKKSNRIDKYELQLIAGNMFTKFSANKKLK